MRATSVFVLTAVALSLLATGCTPASGGAAKQTGRPTPVATASVEPSAVPTASVETTASESSDPAPSVAVTKKSAAPSEKLHHPALGSDERKQILDGLRPTIERDLGQKVIFEIERINVKGVFAFVQAVPRRPSGGKIDYKKTRYRDELEDGVLDGGSDAPVYALLRYRDGKWKTLTFVLGPTDVAWTPWPEEYDAPKAIFPL